MTNTLRNPSLRIGWLLLTPSIGAGGTRTIFDIINLLTSFGHTNVLILNTHAIPDAYQSHPELYIQRHFGHVSAKIHGWYDVDIDVDIILATQWSTFDFLDRYSTNIARGYFVQDYEPYFMSMSYEYLRAERTYQVGVPCITIGAWLAQFLHEKYKTQTYWFDFGIDHTIYYPRVIKQPRNKIIFYARPSTPRRCFYLGLEALHIVHQRYPDAEIVLFGDENLSSLQIGIPFTDSGILSPEQLAQLYSESIVGIVLSPTNPSRTPPEMMACGCPVIDLDLAQNHFIIEHEHTGLLAAAEKHALADAIVRILQERDLANELSANALKYAARFNWEASARQVEAALLAIAESSLSRASTPAPLSMVEHWHGDGVTPAITPNLKVGQRFIAHHDGLTKIAFAVSNHIAEIPQLKLTDGFDQSIVLVETQAATITDNQLVYTFLPLFSSANQVFYCTLTADAGPQLRFDYHAVAGGAMTYNDVPQIGQLLTRFHYQTNNTNQHQLSETEYLEQKDRLVRYEYELIGNYLQHFEEQKHTPVHQPLPWNSRLHKALSLIRRGQMLTLIRELYTYLVWRIKRINN